MAPFRSLPKVAKVVVTVGCGLVLLVLYGFYSMVQGEELLSAARSGDLETARTALRWGADPNYVFEGDFSVLYYAVSNNHYEVASLLLKSGADPSTKTYGG